MKRFAKLREARQVTRVENAGDLAKDLNVILRTTKYVDPDHFKAAVARSVQRLSPDLWPVLLGGEPHHVSARLGVEIPLVAGPSTKKKRRVTEARLRQLHDAREKRRKVSKL